MSIASTHPGRIAALRAQTAARENSEKSVEEVARIVGIPEATVKTRMFYARKNLSELVSGAQYGHSASTRPL